MKRLQGVAEMRAWSRSQRAGGFRIAFVPTMGALHEGHRSLVRLAGERADRVVVSIFVNPTQFGPGEDLGRYPRDIEGDLAALTELDVDALFVPPEEEIYPRGGSTWVVETARSAGLEGAARPGHFRGVTTVVAKLLAVVEPDLLVLGQKDAQQVAVLRRMVTDLLLPVEIVVGPTVREPDGLALSSRNAYLSEVERRQATCLYRSLQLARRLVEEGEGSAAVVLEAMRGVIEEEPSARVDYVAAVDPDTCEPMEDLAGRTLFCVAAFVGTTRLIDNELVDRKR